MMKVKIWSDVRCPFCYIGKRKFERALEKFPHKDQVEVTWHSFQLDPSLKTDPETSTLDYFTRIKGITPDQAQQMLSHATRMAAEVGLDFHLEDSVLGNSFNAHRLIQMAKTIGFGNKVKEALFKAHFSDKENIDDLKTLLSIGTSIGMDKKEVSEMLESDAFAYEVKQDELEARNIGVQGVPFFIIDNKYGISGAQPSEVFLETLEKAWEEYSKANSSLIISKEDSCSPDGTCS